MSLWNKLPHLIAMLTRLPTQLLHRSRSCHVEMVKYPQRNLNVAKELFLVYSRDAFPWRSEAAGVVGLKTASSYSYASHWSVAPSLLSAESNPKFHWVLQEAELTHPVCSAVQRRHERVRMFTVREWVFSSLKSRISGRLISSRHRPADRSSWRNSEETRCR